MVTSVAAAPARALPYVGPRPYARADSDAGRNLYGRDTEVESLFNLLIGQRIVLLYSPSGAGKTSLIEAKLIPRLEAEGFAVLPTARVGLASGAAESPNANRYVASALSTFGADSSVAQHSLEAFLDARRTTADPQLLVLDQFEEILVEDPTDLRTKEEFFRQLGAALRERSRWALIAMREDYVAGLDPFLRFIPGRLSARLRLDLLSPRAALAAITEPAAMVGVDFSPVAEKLVSELSMTRVQGPDGVVDRRPGPYIEPVQLQVVCVRVWEHLAPGTVRVEEADVQAVGDVDEALGGYYEDCVASVARQTHVRERDIRDWVDQQLITRQGVRGQVLQGIENSEGLANRAILGLVAAHLVRAERRRGFTWFELAHDRLVEPVQKNNSAWWQANLSPVQRQAVRWDQQDRPTSALLRGRQLRDAVHWESAHQPELTVTEREFLEVSRAAQTAEERKLNRVVRIAAVVAVLVAGLCVGLAIEASNFADIAQVRDVAMAAQQQADPELALLLATEAARRHPLPEVDSTLRQAFADSHTRLALKGHTGAVWQAVFSPDGSRVVTASIDGTSRLWDSSTGAQIGALNGTDDFCGVAFSPDGARIATVSLSKLARVWDATTGAELTVLHVATQQVCSVAFSPDGASVVTGGPDGVAHIVNASTGQVVGALEGPNVTVWTAAFSPDGAKVVTATADGTARIWSVATQKELMVLEGPPGSVWDAVFSPDGSRIATTGDDGMARVWNASTGVQVAVLTGHTNTITTIAFSPDNRRVVTASHDNTARVWDASTGQLLLTLQGHIDGVRSATFSPDGTHVVTASEDRTARIWDVSSGALESLPVASGEVWSAAFSPDGSLVAAASANGVVVWDIARHATRPLSGYSANTWGVAFSSDGVHLATGGSDNTARIWDVTTGENLQTVQPSSGVRSVAFSADGTQLITASDDGQARIWSLATGMLVQPPFGHPGWSMRSVVFSPDGKQVATASTDKTARIWDAATGRELRVLDHGVVVRNVAFSMDGTRVLTSSVDLNAQIWDVASGERQLTLRGHSAPVWTGGFSPDGSRVITASEDGTARVWDARTGRQLLIVRGHSGPVRSAHFSPDGTEVVTSGADGTVRIVGGCQLTCGLPDLLAQARMRAENAGRTELSAQERSQYLQDTPFWLYPFTGRR